MPPLGQRLHSWLHVADHPSWHHQPHYSSQLARALAYAYVQLRTAQVQADPYLRAYAAERLFTDVRVAGTGDLRINAAVGGDPIGMLANAFNFTIGRFRRFVLRTQTSVEQLDVLARQQLEHAEAFLGALRPFSTVQGGVGDASGRARQHSASPSVISISSGLESPAAPELRAQAQRARTGAPHGS